MKKQINRKIYLLSKKPMKPIEVVQYETGVQLVFEVQDIELDTSATATMFVRKPSGKFVFQEDNISLTGNTVVIDLHNQAITEYGHPFFQIKFKKDEELISTYSGMLTVEKSLDDSGAEESKTVLAAFEELTDEQIARIEEATRSQIDLMKAEVEAKGETVLSTIPDEYTEMYNRVNTLFNSVANAIKGTVSGSVVRVDDVSPVEHSLDVKVICPEGVDPASVTITRCGKNLFNVNAIQTYATIVNNGDGTITAKSFVSQPVATLGEICPNLKAGDAATLSFVSPAVDATQSNKKIDFIYLIGSKESWHNGTTKTVTQEMLDNVIYFYASKNSEGNPIETRISNIQIEVGEVVTEYKPYNEPTTHTPSSDGTVEDITSLSPTMTLLTDTEGVTIECEYNKDTGKVIDNLTKAVVALGGVV